jgi:hypothetical protein
MHAVSLSCTNSRDAMRVVSSRLGVRFTSPPPPGGRPENRYGAAIAAHRGSYPAKLRTVRICGEAESSERR